MKQIRRPKHRWNINAMDLNLVSTLLQLPHV